ncbi:MAG: hypothetical protein FK730_10170 [Asgard group archaeon]|nr:hypothetical protein [Asgard group archaeon]
MKLGKILKNRKAMTPLMIGIIVAASVIAVLFIIMAATIPLMNKDVHIGVIPVSIRGNSTNGEKLIFFIVCDYDDGYLVKLEIEKNGQLYGDIELNMLLEKEEQRNMQIDAFDATTAAQLAGEYNATNNALVFQQNADYTLIVHYTNINGDLQQTDSFEFTFKLPD